MIDKNTYESLEAVRDQQKIQASAAVAYIEAIDERLSELEGVRAHWLIQFDVANATVAAIDAILGQPDEVPLTPPEQPITPAIVPEPVDGLTTLAAGETVVSKADAYRTFGED